MLEPIFLSKNYSTILIWQSQLIFGSVISKKKKKKKNQMVLESVVITTKKSLLPIDRRFALVLLLLA
jgi:hypothetical protein